MNIFSNLNNAISILNQKIFPKNQNPSFIVQIGNKEKAISEQNLKTTQKTLDWVLKSFEGNQTFMQDNYKSLNGYIISITNIIAEIDRINGNIQNGNLQYVPDPTLDKIMEIRKKLVDIVHTFDSEIKNKEDVVLFKQIQEIATKTSLSLESRAKNMLLQLSDDYQKHKESVENLSEESYAQLSISTKEAPKQFSKDQSRGATFTIREGDRLYKSTIINEKIITDTEKKKIILDNKSLIKNVCLGDEEWTNLLLLCTTQTTLNAIEGILKVSLLTQLAEIDDKLRIETPSLAPINIEVKKNEAGKIQEALITTKPNLALKGIKDINGSDLSHENFINAELSYRVTINELKQPEISILTCRFELNPWFELAKRKDIVV